MSGFPISRLTPPQLSAVELACRQTLEDWRTEVADGELSPVHVSVLERALEKLQLAQRESSPAGQREGGGAGGEGLGE